MIEALERIVWAALVLLVFTVLSEQIEGVMVGTVEAREEIIEIKARLDSLQGAVEKPPWWR